MLIITLISLILAIPLFSAGISACLYTRIVAISLLFGGALSYNCFPSFLSAPFLHGGAAVGAAEEKSTDFAVSITPILGLHTGDGGVGDAMDAGVGLYSGIIHITTVTQTMSAFLLLAGAAILLPISASGVHAVPLSTRATRDSTRESNIVALAQNNGVAVQLQGAPANSATLGGFQIIREYPIIILFTVIGASFLVASADLVSMYLSIELQSFGVYILSSLYRDSESATAAGLKYFLLGALSSAFILLGSALVYAYTGLTNLDSIFELIAVIVAGVSGTTTTAYGALPPILGFVIISVGLLFKVAAAPFHSWAPDVYDGTPTIVTTWLTVMPKISIFIFLLELYVGMAISVPVSFSDLQINAGEIVVVSPPSELHLHGLTGSATLAGTTPVQALLLICAFLSLVIGTVVGLRQYRIKRVLAYSTISHVGFLLLALGIVSANGVSGEESLEAFLFYIVQYTATNIDAFFVLLAFGYICWEKNSSVAAISARSASVARTTKSRDSPNSAIASISSGATLSSDINFTSELRGQFIANPVLGLSFAVCLFSMAGVPPIVGFFAKYTILYSAIHNGYVFIAIIAILASVVSAVYYLRIIRVIHFGDGASVSTSGVGMQSAASLTKDAASYDPTNTLTSTHSYIIAVLTLFIMLFALNPTLILNSTGLMALSMYVT